MNVWYCIIENQKLQDIVFAKSASFGVSFFYYRYVGTSLLFFFFLPSPFPSPRFLQTFSFYSSPRNYSSLLQGWSQWYLIVRNGKPLLCFFQWQYCLLSSSFHVFFQRLLSLLRKFIVFSLSSVFLSMLNLITERKNRVILT